MFLILTCIIFLSWSSSSASITKNANTNSLEQTSSFYKGTDFINDIFKSKSSSSSSLLLSSHLNFRCCSFDNLKKDDKDEIYNKIFHKELESLTLIHSLNSLSATNFLQKMLECSEQFSLSNLSHLDLSHNDFDSTNYIIIGKIIKSLFMKIRSIKLNGCKLEDKSLSLLVKQLKNVTSSNIENNNNNDNSNNNLNISLSNCQLNDQSISALNNLAKIYNITSLDISLNQFTSIGIEKLLRSFKKGLFKNLEILDLSYNNNLANTNFFKILSQILKSGSLSNLKILKLKGINLTPVVFENFLALLLDEDDDDVDDINKIELNNNINIEILDLSGNDLFIMKEKKKKKGTAAIFAKMTKSVFVDKKDPADDMLKQKQQKLRNIKQLGNFLNKSYIKLKWLGLYNTGADEDIIKKINKNKPYLEIAVKIK